MAIARQHIPSFLNDVTTASEAEFTTQEELLGLSFIKSFRIDERTGGDDEYFYRYSLADHVLMCEIREGSAWFIIAVIDDVSNLTLPKWEPNEEDIKSK